MTEKDRNPSRDRAEMNSDALYLEETFTDQAVGMIRRLTPVTAEGEPDSARKVLFMGQAQMMTPAGALPLSFEIPASSLAEACAGFAAGAEKAMQETLEQLQEMRRQSASSLVLPGQGGGQAPGGGGSPFVL